MLALFAALIAVPAAAQSPIDAARQLYNQGHFEAAVRLAARLRSNPAMASLANLILGRSYLERYRQSADHADLVAARQALRDVRASSLSGRERAEYLVGLGETLYLEESYGAAAEIFASAFEEGTSLGPRGFDRLFDWWATSLDRLAQSGLTDDRDALYTEVATRAEAALGDVPAAAAPAYWLVVANRSLGDPVAAWDAAVAGWVRAPLAADRGVGLRADLDRLVLEAIIPERVRLMASADRDRERAAATLRGAWEEMKKEWAPR